MSKYSAVCRLEWGEPYGGKGTDTFVLSNQGQRLTQVSQMIYLDDESKNFSYRLNSQIMPKSKISQGNLLLFWKVYDNCCFLQEANSIKSSAACKI